MKLILNIVAFLFACQVFSQANTKDLNLIIIIDEQVNNGIISGVKLIYSLNSGSNDTIYASYCPGKLSLSLSDYEKLLSDEIETVFISFSYTEYCKNKEFSNSYKIDIKKTWLKFDFYILYIYNTDKKKYKKLLEPLEGEDYTYEFDYPGGAMKRVRLRSLKNECN